MPGEIAAETGRLSASVPTPRRTSSRLGSGLLITTVVVQAYKEAGQTDRRAGMHAAGTNRAKIARSTILARLYIHSGQKYSSICFDLQWSSASFFWLTVQCIEFSKLEKKRKPSVGTRSYKRRSTSVSGTVAVVDWLWRRRSWLLWFVYSWLLSTLFLCVVG